MSAKPRPPTSSGFAVRKYLLLLLSFSLLLLVLDMGLEQVGRSNFELRRNPEVWGTYGDWAGALLPAVAILISVDMWRQDRARFELEKLLAAVQDIRLSLPAPNVTWLTNHSQAEIELIAPPDMSLTRVHFSPHEDGMVVNGKVNRLDFMAFDRIWTLSLDAPPTLRQSREL